MTNEIVRVCVCVCVHRVFKIQCTFCTRARLCSDQPWFKGSVVSCGWRLAQWSAQLWVCKGRDDLSRSLRRVLTQHQQWETS